MDSKKKALFLSILVILIGIVAGVGITYAYWASKLVLNNDNVVSSGCLQMEFKDLSNPISENRVGPESYGENSSYTFTITNTCTTAINYQVNLETLEGTTLDTSYIEVDYEGYNIHNLRINNQEDLEYFNSNVRDNLNDEDIYSNYDDYNLNELEETSATLPNAISSNIINKGILKSEETHFYTVNTWFSGWNEDGTNEKAWYSKITVNSTPLNQIKVTLDSNGGTLSTNELYIAGTDNYGKLPEPTKEGYYFYYWYLDGEEDTPIRNYSELKSNKTHTLKAKYLNNNEYSLLNVNSFQISESYNIKEIKPYTGTPNATILQNAEIISEEGSPTYKWIDGDILYYYSEANVLFVQEEIFGNHGSTDGFVNTTRIDLSKIDTSKVTDMSYMFSGLTKLEYLDISGFNTSNVTNMKYMFEGCRSLTTVNIENFNMNKVIYTKAMFSGCSSLELITMPSTNNNVLENMGSMFVGCTNLRSVDFSNFNVSNVHSMQYMFADCENLASVDLTTFNLSKVEEMYNMFENDTSLTRVTFGVINNTDNIVDEAMLCGTNESLEIIGYTPSQYATSC